MGVTMAEIDDRLGRIETLLAKLADKKLAPMCRISRPLMPCLNFGKTGRRKHEVTAMGHIR